MYCITIRTKEQLTSLLYYAKSENLSTTFQCKPGNLVSQYLIRLIKRHNYVVQVELLASVMGGMQWHYQRLKYA